MSTARSRSGAQAGVSALQPRTNGLELSVLWTLFTLSLRQFLRGKRMIVLALLSLLPAGLALLLRLTKSVSSELEVERSCLFFLVPQVLLPLTSLLYASGMILDEQEEQTLTYLLVRPLPKSALYLTKLLATMCMIAILGLVFVIVTDLATYVGSAKFSTLFPFKMLMTIVVMTLTLATYAAVFGCLSLMTKHSMIVGILYIAVVEGLLANFNFPIRKLTVMYYFRVLSLNWLNLDSELPSAWSIETNDAPDPIVCVITMLGIIAGTTFLAVRIFSTREFHVKTPEGS